MMDLEAIRYHGFCRLHYHSAEKRLTLQLLSILRSFGLPKEEARAALKLLSVGQAQDETQPSVADHVSGEGGDQRRYETHDERVPALPPVGSAHRQLLDDLDSQRLAIKRWRKRHEKELSHLGEALPAWDAWAKDVRGVGSLGLALIIYETGDLANYATVSRVWKRLGLAVIGGGCQRRVTDKKLALEMGFNPRRRSVMWNVGGALVKQGEHYRELYLARKEIEAARPGCGRALYNGGTKCPGPEGHCRPIHLHRRAQRWMEKEFVKDLWAAWTSRGPSGRSRMTQVIAAAAPPPAGSP